MSAERMEGNTRATEMKAYISAGAYPAGDDCSLLVEFDCPFELSEEAVRKTQTTSPTAFSPSITHLTCDGQSIVVQFYGFPDVA